MGRVWYHKQAPEWRTLPPLYGEMSERLKEPVLKTGEVKASVGSNPTLSATILYLRKYPRGRRGSPAKGVGWLKTGARVQIPPSAPRSVTKMDTHTWNPWEIRGFNIFNRHFFNVRFIDTKGCLRSLGRIWTKSSATSTVFCGACNALRRLFLFLEKFFLNYFDWGWYHIMIPTSVCRKTPLRRKLQRGNSSI